MNLGGSNILKHDYAAIFANKIESGSSFELVDGSKVILKKDQSTIKAFKERVFPQGFKVTTQDGEVLSLSRFQKTNEFKGITGPKISNKGDVAEGIIATAIFMKFAGLNMTENTLESILQNKIRVKTEYVVTNNSNPRDTIVLYINLAKNHFESLTSKEPVMVQGRKDIVQSALQFTKTRDIELYNNYFSQNKIAEEIRVISDGLGGQKETKTDVYVELKRTQKLDKEIKTVTRRLNLNISLKVGDVKQFGQVSGSEFKNQKELWKMFGVDITPIQLKYNTLLETSKVSEAICLAYQTAYNKFKAGFSKNSKDISTIITLFQAIQHHATLGENIKLVSLSRGTFKQYTFNLSKSSLESLAANHSFTVQYITSGGKFSLPKVIILMDGIPLLSIRSKSDERNDGSFYARNYIEKEKAFDVLFKK